MTVRGCAKCLPWLRKVARARGSVKRSKIFNEAPKALITAIQDIIKNILNGKIHLKMKQKLSLKRYKNVLRTFTRNCKTSSRKQRKFLIQKGGFLPALLTPIISILASIATEKLLK